MHLFVPEVGLMGTTGIVGPNILQATGAGYSFQLMKTDQVSVAFFGDGAMNNGAFHEGVNMAAIWGLPVVYVCENNQFATEVPFDYATRNTDVAERAPRLWHSRDAGRWQRCAGGHRGRRGRDRASAPRRRTVADRRPHLSHPPARRRDARRRLSHRRRDRRVESSAIRSSCWKPACSTGVRDPGADRRSAPGDRGRRRRRAEFAKNSPYPEPDTAALHIYGKNERGCNDCRSRRTVPSRHARADLHHRGARGAR